MFMHHPISQRIWNGQIKSFRSHLKRVKRTRFKINYIVIFPGALYVFYRHCCCCCCCSCCCCCCRVECFTPPPLEQYSSDRRPATHKYIDTHIHVWVGRWELVSLDTPIPYVTQFATFNPPPAPCHTPRRGGCKGCASHNTSKSTSESNNGWYDR